jgi:hypothetical protein
VSPVFVQVNMRHLSLVISATLLWPAPLRASESLDQWLLRFEAAATAPKAFQPGGLGTVRSLAPLTAFHNDPCTHMFALADVHPPFLEGATVLTNGRGHDCTDPNVVVTLATFYLRISSARLATLRDAITSRLGSAPRLIDDSPNKTLHWQVTPARAVEVVTFPGSTLEQDTGLSMAQSPDNPTGHVEK